MAVTVGFEPTIRVSTYDDLANRCLKPLGHVTAIQIYQVTDAMLSIKRER